MTQETYRLADLYGAGLAAWELLYYAKFGKPMRVIEDVISSGEERRMLTDAQLMMMISTQRMCPSIDWLPPPIREWLLKCIKFNPRDRYDTLGSAQRALQGIYKDFIRFLPQEEDIMSNPTMDGD
jgi:hypothetical protein